MNFLTTILADKRLELARAKAEVSLKDLQQLVDKQAEPLSFIDALKKPGIRIIAEVKKASPSKGVLAQELDPERTAVSYASGGTAAISVLTEPKHFQGNLSYLGLIKKKLGDDCPPLLRKDFLTEEYQIYESRAAGADALLLIVAALGDSTLGSLLELTHKLNMEALVEVHTEEETRRAVKAGAKVIGINNRNLTTFETTIETSLQLRPLIPQNRLVVSESGIKTPDDIRRLNKAGINVFLIGEALVIDGNPSEKIKSLMNAVNK
ncbi:MAG: indole-3-glycerol phosphate synthase TrpC [Dehalococcoidia bacterium]|nr:indole-3-glycerol phosphate synthase TrpC [Dehalococcoidia bacterium]